MARWPCIHVDDPQLVWSLDEAELSTVTAKSVRTEVERRLGLEDGDLASFRREILQEVGQAADAWPEEHALYEEAAGGGDGGGSDSDEDGGSDDGSSSSRRRKAD
eukprot:COSAG06_NODE_227_length_19736_cov_15.570708_3_plen_105_part_00